MILTHTGKLGDFFPCLTISNYYYKNGGERTTFVLTSWFKQFNGLQELLMRQPCVEGIIFDPYSAPAWGLGGTDYKFKPAHITDELYYNLGMNQWPIMYLGELYASEYNLNCDKDISLNFLYDSFPDELKGKKLYTKWDEKSTRADSDRYDREYRGQLEEQGFEPFDTTKPLLYNLNLAHYASEVKMFPEGFSVLADMARIKFTLQNNSVNPKVYYIHHTD